MVQELVKLSSDKKTLYTLPQINCIKTKTSNLSKNMPERNILNSYLHFYTDKELNKKLS